MKHPLCVCSEYLTVFIYTKAIITNSLALVNSDRGQSFALKDQLVFQG